MDLFLLNLINLWKFLKNSPKRLHIYVKVALKTKNVDSFTNKRKTNIVKRMKKACRTRWLSLDAGVDAVFEEYEGIINTLKVLEMDRNSGPTATGLLNKIKN